MSLSTQLSLPIRDNSQNGFSLIVSLLMLVVIIILGMGAANMALNEERSTRNDRDRQIAFQAAEAALKDAEQEILDSTIGVACGDNNQYRGRSTDICFDGLSKEIAGFVSACSTASTTQGLCVPSTTPTPVWESVSFSTTGSGAPTVAYGTFTGKIYPTGGGNQSALAPRYIIEIVPRNNITDPDEYAQYSNDDPQMYRITAIGYGANANAQVVLQSVVNTKTNF